MFDNIENIQIVIAVAAVFVVAYMALVQYSRYVAHKKKHMNDSDEDIVTMANTFAVIPYAVIPFLFAAGAVFAGLVLTDYAVGRMWVDACVGPMIAAPIFTIAVYILMDIGLVKHVGDAVYFDTIESKFRSTVVEPVVSDDKIAQALMDLLKGKV